jgi:hypothetical protein
MNEQNCIQCDLILPELEERIEKQKRVQAEMAKRIRDLEFQIRGIEAKAKELEDAKPMVVIDSLVGEVVPIIEYLRLQLAFAKHRAYLETKIEALEKQLK